LVTTPIIDLLINKYSFIDGVFGQCYSPSSGAPKPTVIDHLDDTQLELLRLELTRLAKQGLEWPDQRAQCVLSYFKLSMYYGLQYDPDFCQLIEMGLNEDPTALESEADEVPVIAEDVDVADDSNRIVSDFSNNLSFSLLTRLHKALFIYSFVYGRRCRRQTWESIIMVFGSLTDQGPYSINLL
uniref:LisH domain-containing protein n=1 Tax=Haemonchus placei TaxID=6290 RepID=A0A0N4WPE0_HAEPC